MERQLVTDVGIKDMGDSYLVFGGGTNLTPKYSTQIAVVIDGVLNYATVAGTIDKKDFPELDGELVVKDEALIEKIKQHLK